MNKFEYKGYNFKMDEWNTDDYSDRVEGIVKIEIEDDEWETIVEYSGFENNAIMTLADDESTTEFYHEDDNFYYDEDTVKGFLGRNLSNVEQFVKEVFK